MLRVVVVINLQNFFPTKNYLKHVFACLTSFYNVFLTVQSLGTFKVCDLLLCHKTRGGVVERVRESIEYLNEVRYHDSLM